MVVKLTFKLGQQVVSEIVGRPRASETITLGDLENLIAIESFIEKMTGYRLHTEVSHGDEVKVDLPNCSRCGHIPQDHNNEWPFCGPMQGLFANKCPCPGYQR